MDYDLIVLGGGPAGYTGAIRAAQLGKKVLVIDDREGLGGTCLNIGCIPSKVLLHNSYFYTTLQKHGVSMGVEFQKLSYSVDRLMELKNKTVKGFNLGVSLLLKKNKVDHVKGIGQFISSTEIQVQDKTYKGKSILVATGSYSTPIPGIEVDEKSIVSSTGALSFSKAPKSLVVIGGGVIGLELGSVWNNLGSKVDIIEFMPRLLSNLDMEASKMITSILKQQGLNFHLGSKVTKVEKKDSLIEVTYESDGKESKIMADKVLVAVGRKPQSSGFGLDKVGVQTDDRGFIKVDSVYKTNIPSIYAVGDVIGNPMLAHKGEQEAVVCVENMSGIQSKVNYSLIPNVVYTEPEMAWIGYSEQDLKDKGIPYVIGKFPFIANSRARIYTPDNPAGFVKIFAHKETDRVLGAIILGFSAGELIMEVAAVMTFGGSSEDIGMIIHPHPTLSEAVKEAALAVHKEAINI